MISRRTVLKQGVYATLSAVTAAALGRSARAQGASSGGFDFYISPSGSDSSPGTFEQPWAITALNTRRPDYAGKRVGLLDGTYYVVTVGVTDKSGSQVALAVNGGPSPASPTVVAAVNARQAILTPADPYKGAPIIGQGYLQMPNKGNVILDGLYITRASGSGIFFFPVIVPNVQEGGTTGIVIRNCEIHDLGGNEANNPAGIKLRNCTGTLVSNNKIHSVQMAPGHNAAGILSFNCRSNIYEYNTIFDCNSGIYDKNPHTGNHTYRYNHIEIAGAYPANALTDCSGGDAGDLVTVHNNVLIAPNLWDGADPAMPSKQSLLFYNNTCISKGRIFYPAGGALSSPPAMVTLYNNIIYSSGVTVCAGSIALCDYNIYRAGGLVVGLTQVAAPRGPGTAYTLSEWQKTSGQDAHSVVSNAAPSALFGSTRSLEPGTYQLQASSAGRNLGRAGGVSSGAATDVGAWGGGTTRVGCDFGPAPRAPALGVS
jgi:hypothetical protein